MICYILLRLRCTACLDIIEQVSTCLNVYYLCGHSPLGNERRRKALMQIALSFAATTMLVIGKYKVRNTISILKRTLLEMRGSSRSKPWDICVWSMEPRKATVIPESMGLSRTIQPSVARKKWGAAARTLGMTKTSWLMCSDQQSCLVFSTYWKSQKNELNCKWIE